MDQNNFGFTILYVIVLIIAMLIFYFAFILLFSFIFKICYNKSLHEMYPDDYPEIDIWQSLSLLVVLSIVGIVLFGAIGGLTKTNFSYNSSTDFKPIDSKNIEMKNLQNPSMSPSMQNPSMSPSMQNPRWM